MSAANDTPAMQPRAIAPVSRGRQMVWCVRRELWENRSITVAPLIVTAIVLFTCLAMSFGIPTRVRRAGDDPVQHHRALVQPAAFAPAPIMFTTFLVAMFYCADALTGERRDRTLLFWKSLPVSDGTTVLSKFAVAMIVLPLIAFVLGELAHFAVMLVGSVALATARMNPFELWAALPFPSGMVVAGYGLLVHALWFAPIYGWLLLVSAWARRAPILWAIFPAFVLAMVERMALRTQFVSGFIRYRLQGAMLEAFDRSAPIGKYERLHDLDPANFFTRPGLWLGLLFAAGCIALAVRLRRNREPA